MASHKNQHFVPRCYLKPFTAGGQGVAINLFNFDRQRVIEQAPVKNQCSGDYFYGKDLVLERDLQQIEGAYAATLSQVLRDGYVLTDQDRHFLPRGGFRTPTVDPERERGPAHRKGTLHPSRSPWMGLVARALPCPKEDSHEAWIS